eukprot:633467-Pelagomonas_calceolata.AAC.1
MPSPSAPCRSIFGSGPLRQTPSSFPWRYASAQPARHSPPSHAAHFRPPVFNASNQEARETMDACTGLRTCKVQRLCACKCNAV